jgi:hypothetical protein
MWLWRVSIRWPWDGLGPLKTIEKHGKAIENHAKTIEKHRKTIERQKNHRKT